MCIVQPHQLSGYKLGQECPHCKCLFVCHTSVCLCVCLFVSSSNAGYYVCATSSAGTSLDRSALRAGVCVGMKIPVTAPMYHQFLNIVLMTNLIDHHIMFATCLAR